MASTLTRSSRRAGGVTTRSELTLHQNNAYNGQSLSNATRLKRPRESSDHDQEAIKPKKARIAIEFEARPKAQPKRRSPVIASDATSEPVAVAQRSTPKNATTQTAIAKARVSSKYAEKVANGVRHELNRLRPSEVDKKDEKRTLRSQEGQRFKSELSAYFPDYDVVIGNEPEETRTCYNPLA